MTYDHFNTVIITPKVMEHALRRLFDDSVTMADQIPRLRKFERIPGARPVLMGEKPLLERIEYRLLTDTPKDADGNLHLGDMLQTFDKLRYDPQLRRTVNFDKDASLLAGTRLIAVIAYESNMDTKLRTDIRHFITNIEHEVNLGGKECGGRLSVLGNSYRPEIESVDRWLRGLRKNQIKAQESHAARAADPGAPVLRQ